MLFREFLEDNNITLTAKHVRECVDTFYTIKEDDKEVTTDTKVMYLRFTKPLDGDKPHKTHVCLSYHARLAVEDKSSGVKIKDLELQYDDENGYGLIMPDGHYVDNVEDLLG